MADEDLPPHYILLSQTTLPNSSLSGTGAQASSTTATPTLAFPMIHYHYADDPPLSLIPSSKGKETEQQQYIILDYDPGSPHAPLLVRSISDGLAVVGVKVTDAPGIGQGVDDGRNTHMYVIDTVYSGSTVRYVTVIILDRNVLGRHVEMEPLARTQGTTDSQQDWINDPAGAVARFKQRYNSYFPAHSVY
jgi:hypothetical protein